MIKQNTDSMPTHYGLTPREREILEGLVKLKNYPTKQKALHITVASIKNSLTRVRKRYDRATLFNEEYRRFREKMKGGILKWL